MLKSLEYKRSEILDAINNTEIVIPHYQTVKSVGESINGVIDFERSEEDSMGSAAFSTIILVKVSTSKVIENILFKGKYNEKGIDWLGKIKEKEFDISHFDSNSGKPLKISIPENELQSLDNSNVKLPDTFIGEFFDTGIGTMGTLNIGGKEINITNHNF